MIGIIGVVKVLAAPRPPQLEQDSNKGNADCRTWPQQTRPTVRRRLRDDERPKSVKRRIPTRVGRTVIGACSSNTFQNGGNDERTKSY
jgi:hypothetical protein